MKCQHLLVFLNLHLENFAAFYCQDFAPVASWLRQQAACYDQEEATGTSTLMIM